jgi:hypothetical protein
MVDGGRRWIRLQLGHRVKIRLASRFVRRQRHRRSRWRVHDDGRRYGRLAGVQDDLLRPFVLGPDPDGRPVDDLRPIRKARRGFRQTPASDQQKRGKRAADNHKIFGDGHRRQLPRVEQSRYAFATLSPLRCAARAAHRTVELGTRPRFEVPCIYGHWIPASGLPDRLRSDVFPDHFDQVVGLSAEHGPR